MFEQSLKLQKSYNIYTNLGTLYYIEGKYNDAANMYEEALKINNNSYISWGNLGAAYNEIPGKKNEAKNAYKTAISNAEKKLEINPNDPEVVSNLAGYYADIGDSSKALTMLKNAINKAPGNAIVMYSAGSTYEILGNREKALYWIGKAISNGYPRSQIERQPELRNLVADKRYKQIISQSR